MFNEVAYSFQFEAGVRAKCPSPCHFHHYQPVIVTSASSVNHHLVSSAKLKGGSFGAIRSNVDTRLNSRVSNAVASAVHADDVATLEIRDRQEDPAEIDTGKSFAWLQPISAKCSEAETQIIWRWQKYDKYIDFSQQVISIFFCFLFATFQHSSNKKWKMSKHVNRKEVWFACWI